MPEAIFNAKLAMYVTNHENDNADKRIIYIGKDGVHNFRGLMFFDVSSLLQNSTISSAKLVLFKIKDFYPSQSRTIKVHALLDYFSFKTTYNNIPSYESFFVEAPIDNNKITVEIDIKDILSRWVDGSLENKGIIIFLNEDRKSLMAFTSYQFPVKYFRPLLRVEYTLPQVPNIIVSNQIVKFIEHESILVGSAQAFSIVFDTSYLLDSTAIAKNEGSNSAKLIIEYSNDNANWVEDISFDINPGQTKIIVPRFYSKFIRFKAEAPGNILIRLRYIYKEFMH